MAKACAAIEAKTNLRLAMGAAAQRQRPTKSMVSTAGKKYRAFQLHPVVYVIIKGNVKISANANSFMYMPLMTRYHATRVFIISFFASSCLCKLLPHRSHSVPLRSIARMWLDRPGESFFEYCRGRGTNMSGFSLKDQLFNRDKVSYLAGLFAVQDRSFDRRRFVDRVMRRLDELELKQRIVLIAESLIEHLPKDFSDAAALIVRSLPPPLDESKSDDDFGDFIFAPLGEFVARQGMSAEHFELSLQTLKEITKRFSMEYAVRDFIRGYPTETLAELACWTADPNYHVRRLVSEGTRPLLPWSGRIGLPVETTLPLLDSLHADPTRFVTRSVANHLNDIAKTHPELVVRTLRGWHRQARQDQEELMWMTRHALRTLIKRGDADALKLLGFRTDPKLNFGELRIAKTRLVAGETLEFSFEITALRDEALVVDYTIDFPKASGKRSSKVFKAASFDLKKGQSQVVTKKHKLLAQATTYRLYAGEHFLSIQVNGQSVGRLPFTVVQAK